MSNDITAVLAAIEKSPMQIAELTFKLVNPDLLGTTSVQNVAPAAPAEAEPEEKPKSAPKKAAPKKAAAKPKPKPEPEEEDDKRDPDDVGESDEDDGDGDDTPVVDVKEVQDAARAVVRAKKPEVLKGLCEKYGVKKISDADPAMFAEILEALQEAVED